MAKKYKVYYDLCKSPCVVKTDNFTFHFSTEKRKQRFLNGVEESRKKLRVKLQSQYGIKADTNDYADMYYYADSECKGFYVVKNDTKEVITCLNNITLIGEIKTKKN